MMDTPPAHLLQHVDAISQNEPAKLRGAEQGHNVEEASLLREEPAVSVAELSPAPQQHRQSRGTIASAHLSPLGIHWRSPITMVSTFLSGLASAVALHCYYSSLNGERVGDTNQQQRALRYVVHSTFIHSTSLPCINRVYRLLDIKTKQILTNRSIELVLPSHSSHRYASWAQYNLHMFSASGEH